MSLSRTQLGFLAGAGLVVVWSWLGFWTVVLALVVGGIGAGVGMYLEGRLDPEQLKSAFRGKRSS